MTMDFDKMEEIKGLARKVIGAVAVAAVSSYITAKIILPVNNNPGAFNPSKAHFKVKNGETAIKYEGKTTIWETDQDSYPKVYKRIEINIAKDGKVTIDTGSYKK
jgi:predicted ribosome-associated RNA-binding protein Tma20